MTPQLKAAITRVPKDLHDALEAAAFLRRCSVGELLRPIVEKVAEELLTDTAVQRVVKERQLVDASRAPNVRPFSRSSASSEGSRRSQKDRGTP
jgi:hypothetical protein